MINKRLSRHQTVIVGEKGRASHYGSEGREFESSACTRNHDALCGSSLDSAGDLSRIIHVTEARIDTLRLVE